ncbi:NUDIX domain-containing protein [Kineosporia babensis]|uniref:NUDIX domain-containing protein n=1 Tax=Kineosporia babensis TaxID=499548 RepID=A0A9X1NN45_9ACTN|nr:NUDIX domain-containing protein [Kineosporia babensis]MCD5317165.1 NUDIX domain-containing protein [Kineosporia babensis]
MTCNDGRRPLVEYTDPATFTAGVAEGWAEAETDPTRIDWTARQAAALLPFEVRAGRPVTPGASTGIDRGRNGLGLWGENPMADALVTAQTDDGVRWVLLVERGDGHGWAVPGGSIETGESPQQAAARELSEETTFAVLFARWECSEPRWVPDPRASDEAWAVTVVAHTHLHVGRLPQVKGADDARRAAWIRAESYHAVVADLADRGGRVFAAHCDLLRQYLDSSI